jgi:hypothetical protein
MSKTTTISIGRKIYQRSIPVFLVSFITAVFIAQYFVDYEPLNIFVKEANNWGVIISTFTLLYGSILLLMGNIRSLIARRSMKEVFNSAVFLFFMMLYIVVGVSDPRLTNSPAFLGLNAGVLGVINIILWMNATAFANWETLKAVSRVRSVDGLAFLASFLFIVFFRMTVFLAIWPPFFSIGNWIITVPNVGVTRAALGAAAVGGVVLGIRALLGKEPGLIEMEMK